jgi:hypothetical protein
MDALKASAGTARLISASSAKQPSSQRGRSEQACFRFWQILLQKSVAAMREA